MLKTPVLGSAKNWTRYLMGKRQKTIQRFLEINGWSNAERIKLGGDASFRNYYRLNDKGRGAILMDAPPDLEQVDPFLKIARHLKSLGYSAHSIFAANRGLGLVLLEDFGENTCRKTGVGGFHD